MPRCTPETRCIAQTDQSRTGRGIGSDIARDNQEDTPWLRPGDLDFTVCKKKELINMRAANADQEIRLTTPTHLSLEEAINYLNKDELLEVTPVAYRIRTQILSAHDRGKMNKSARKAALEEEG